jgi:hypothetical protein
METKKKVKIGVLVGIIVVILGIYLGGFVFYQSNFYPGTTACGLSIENKSVDSAEEALAELADSYVVTITKDGTATQDTISAGDIDAEYIYNGSDGTGENILQTTLDNQNPALWFVEAFSNNTEIEGIELTYSKSKLKKAVNALECMDPEKTTPPIDAYIQYKDGAYEVVPEVIGTEVDESELMNAVADAITSSDGQVEITTFYSEPEIKEDSEEITSAMADLEKIMGSSITINDGTTSVTLSGKKIHKLITGVKHLNVRVDEDAVYEYVTDELKPKFNTVGIERTVNSPGSGKFTISGGTFGNLIDRDLETAQIVEELTAGETVEREPNYYSKDSTKKKNGGIGTTYIEVNIASQMVYCVKKGELVYSSSVVTGNPNAGNGTPTGVYRIEYHSANWYMEKYQVFTYYWMPIDLNTGVGLHDATWRSTFGGSYYLSSGSHGCINMPLSTAKYVFNNFADGTPVIVHYN